jgi:hypothetical protein
VTGLYDIYVLSPKRSTVEIARFLDRFLPDREETADEYVIPQFSDTPEIEFRDAETLLTYLCENPNEPHAVYWLSKAACDPRCAMVFPMTGGQIVYGLSVEENEQEYLETLKTFMDSPIGYIDFENPPPDSPSDFEKVASDLKKNIGEEPGSR